MLGLLDLLAQGQTLDPTPSGDFRVSPSGFIVVFGVGFAIAVAGHVVRSRAMVAFGIALIFGATVLVPVLLAVTN